MSTVTTSPRDTVLDALAVLMAAERGDLDGMSAMAATYDTRAELCELLGALTAVALCAVRYSATTAGQAPERLLAGIAQEVRAQA